MTYEIPTEDDLKRIQRCLPDLDDDGEANFAVVLGNVGKREEKEPEASFDTDDVHRLVSEVRRLRGRLDAIGGRHWPARHALKATRQA